MIKIKTLLITTLLFLSLGCSANPKLGESSKPYSLPGGGMMIPKASNTVFTMCGLPIILAIHGEEGVEIYGGQAMVERSKKIDPNDPLVVAELSKTWGDNMVQCPTKSDTKTPAKKKPREWYAGF